MIGFSWLPMGSLSPPISWTPSVVQSASSGRVRLDRNVRANCSADVGKSNDDGMHVVLCLFSVSLQHCLICYSFFSFFSFFS
ncbi:unnamed protein product, partial [Protopolystoma xenopodis]